MQRQLWRVLAWCICLLGSCGLLSLSPYYLFANQSAASYRLFLPVVLGSAPPAVFGVETSQLSSERGLEGLVAMQPYWVRRNGLRWKDVEPVEGAGYQWNTLAVQALEAEMIRASEQGLQLILIVRGSPAWATTPYQADCAPIHPSKYAAFAQFMAAAVQRYSQPPYNVRFWELGNEPDAYVFPNDSVYGCWGVQDDPYYGGREYGEMLKVVYPAIKAANPYVQVLNGGLLLDKPYDPTTGNGRSARFIEGVFATGAGNAFDILSYHSYTYYDGTVDGSSGRTDWKIPYLRNLMAQYQISKPLFNSEGALLCTVSSNACFRAQANIIGRIYARALRDGLMAFVWYAYDSDSFMHTALVEPANLSNQRPAYLAYRHAAQMLRNVRYSAALEQQPSGVEGYRFSRGTGTVWVVWSDTPVDITIPFPVTQRVTCTAWDGAPIACAVSDTTVTITASSSPTYIVAQP